MISLLQEPAKLTKSAIKKANRLARLERKQRQKLKQGSEQEQQPVASTTLPQPVTAVILEERSSSPLLVLSSESLPSKPQSLEQASNPQQAPKTSLDEFVPVPTVSSHAPAISIPTEDTPTTTSTNVPVPEVKEDKYSSRNGSIATMTIASDNQVSRPDPETAKKRQNILTRTLWTFIMIGGFVGNYLRTICSQLYPLTFSMQVSCSLGMPT
jgi:phosphatidate cytidylyltransferase